MSASLNKSTLIGRLGKDPEIKYMPNGEAVTNISIATSETWKDKAGVKQERVEWHRIVFFRKLAEVAGEYLKKGSNVYIEGKITTRKWTDKAGAERYTTEIIANEMKMLDSKPKGEQHAAPRHEATAGQGAAEEFMTGEIPGFDDEINF